MFNIYLQLMNGNMYKSIATSEMDDNSPSQGNHALGNGNMNGTLQKLRDPDGNEIYKPQPVYDNTIQTRKLPDLPNTPESLGRSLWLLSTAFGIHGIYWNFHLKVRKSDGISTDAIFVPFKLCSHLSSVRKI